MTAFGAPTPILRIFDEAKAREFYVDFLGFEITFEHRFGDNFPIYIGLRRDGCELHLSEHHGDCSPGARVRIPLKTSTTTAPPFAPRTIASPNPASPRTSPGVRSTSRSATRSATGSHSLKL